MLHRDQHDGHRNDPTAPGPGRFRTAAARQAGGVGRRGLPARIGLGGMAKGGAQSIDKAPWKLVGVCMAGLLGGWKR